MSVPPPSVPPQELRITLGRRAYRWPLLICVAALSVAVLGSLLARSAAVGDARRGAVLFGGGGALVAFAAVAWAVVIFRSRLAVTVGEKGLVLRRGKAEAAVPVAAMDAIGIAWPVTDPVWTVWFDPGAAPGVAAVTKVEGHAATLLQGRSLPSGWLVAVRAATGTLGVPWRVLDDEGAEVEPPAPDALARADRVTVDTLGRYRDRRGGTLLAVAYGRRTVVLRNPHAVRLLVFRRPTRLPGRDRMRVLDAQGRPIGRIRGLHEPSFHAADGKLLGTTRRDGERYVVTGVDGRESAVLRTRTDADDGRMWLERSPSAPATLRALTLALPMVVRITRSAT